MWIDFFTPGSGDGTSGSGRGEEQQVGVDRLVAAMPGRRNVWGGVEGIALCGGVHDQDVLAYTNPADRAHAISPPQGSTSSPSSQCC